MLALLARMMSSVAWLDTSPEEQRQVRELLRLFTQPDSRDEIGIGPIRDALSDSLFPGVSVLQTRARYHLFVPWCFLTAARSVRDPGLVAARAERLERELVETLRATPGIGSGVIGASAGRTVKILPSSIYWNAMLRLGTLRRDVAPSRLVSRIDRGADADELAERELTDWHPSLPAPPPGFPKEVPGGFDLTPAEAQWLRERIADGARGTLLARLALHPQAPLPESPSPWRDPVVLDAAGPTQPVLDHAHAFSLVMQGATALYNLLLAREYIAAGFNRTLTDTDRHEERFEQWLDGVEAERAFLAGWDLPSFWALVREQNPRIRPRTTAFVEQWVSLVREGAVRDGADDTSAAARLVRERERTLKRSQSRFDNTRLLGQWSGQSMAEQLTYRWPNVRTLLTDIHEGVARAGA